MSTNTVIEPERLMEAANALEPLPVSVTRLASLVASDDYAAGDVVEVIAFDQALTALILRAANSASSGTSKPVATVHEAVVRLGGGPVLTLATNGAVRSRLKQHTDPNGARFDMWRHSVTAALASELVKNATSLYVPASVMTAALLHDVGRLVLAKALTPHMLHLIAQLAEAENLAPLEAERAVLMTDHAELGAIAAEAWQLPDTIVEAIRHHHAPLQSSSPLATIVALADELAHTTEQDDPYQMPNSATISAIEALDIPPEEYGDMVASTIERYEQLAERFDA